MGYNTDFKGFLKISPELKASELAYLMKYLGEDVREHPEWHNNKYAKDLDYINLEMSEDLQGIEWDECEKTYEMVNQINFIITEMYKILPTFTLSGELLAQGEEYDDRWKLIINENGVAEKKDIVVVGDKIQCPHCLEYFIVEHKNDD